MGQSKIKKMPFKKIWTEELARELGTTAADDLFARFERKYQELCVNHPEVTDKILAKHLYGNIFPQMAAYKVFLEDSKFSKDAFERIETLHRLTLKGLRSFYEWLGKMPFGYAFLRFYTPVVIKFQHPSSGWEIEWIESSNKQINLKVHSCFYYEILKKYGMPEFIALFCRGDDYVFEEVKVPNIQWAREKSIARGYDCCDIIWYNPKKFKPNQ